jgi:4-diphosphocytidyl-2-C-methyl-D-erythritol kinase
MFDHGAWPAETLGSDVPFFLLGGTAVGIGRGAELFPLPDAPAGPAVVIAPGIHVNTAAAYRALSPRLTSESQQNKIFSFQTHTWNLGAGELAGNDFEDVVFQEHAILARVKKELARAGASPAMMTGSGSALFGIFKDREQATCALGRLRGIEKAFRVSLVTRARYRSIWWRALREHTTPGIWPPQGRNIR